MSLHRLAAPTFLQLLGSMDGILQKAIAHCDANKIDQSALLQARLFPDMYPLVKQVQSTCDHAAGACLRLALRDATNPPRDETSFQALAARVAGAIAKVKSVSAEQMDANAERELTIAMGSREFKMLGWNYMVHHALPNFYFHHTTAYDILRHNGVAIGKRDFLGVVPGLSRS